VIKQNIRKRKTILKTR